jgi:hypothetical protein
MNCFCPNNFVIIYGLNFGPTSNTDLQVTIHKASFGWKA